MNKLVFISAPFASIVVTRIGPMSGIMLRASTSRTHFNTNALTVNISAPVISHYLNTIPEIIKVQFKISGFEKSPKSPSELENYISEIYPDGGGKLWNCSLCNLLSHRSKINVRNHIESVHFPGSFTYQCQQCGKECSSNNSLSLHVSRYHKK